MAYPNKNMQTNDLLNYYLTMNMNNICRICLEKSNKLTPIFDPIKPPHFSVLITACASVQVQEGDGLPPYICQRCISRLNIAFQFKTQCESSDEKLRKCFENYNLPQTPDYSEGEIKEGSANSNNSTNISTSVDKEKLQYVEAAQSNKQDEFPKEEQVSDKVYNGCNVNIVHVETVHTLQNEQNKLDMEEYYEQQENTVKIEDLNIVSVTNNISDDKKISKKTQKIHQCNTCGKIFKTKPSLIHHIRIHTGERPYVCHLCQKRFVNGGHLHTHMKTHTGEKNHICAACNKGFATTQQLTKHTIAIHTSERPYGCTYCPKRFASSSNLNTHIKIHTGEKNYHCEVCGKTFSTKGQLQQHMLVHTGEKAFLCEYCNKSFSQKAHLLRHLRTHNPTD